MLRCWEIKVSCTVIFAKTASGGLRVSLMKRKAAELIHSEPDCNENSPGVGSPPPGSCYGPETIEQSAWWSGNGGNPGGALGEFCSKGPLNQDPNKGVSKLYCATKEKKCLEGTPSQWVHILHLVFEGNEAAAISNKLKNCICKIANSVGAETPEDMACLAACDLASITNAPNGGSGDPWQQPSGAGNEADCRARCANSPLASVNQECVDRCIQEAQKSGKRALHNFLDKCGK